MNHTSGYMQQTPGSVSSAGTRQPTEPLNVPTLAHYAEQLNQLAGAIRGRAQGCANALGGSIPECQSGKDKDIEPSLLSGMIRLHGELEGISSEVERIARTIGI